MIHDPADGIVPVGQAEFLREELAGLPDGHRHRVLVTRLMRHVNLTGALNMRQVFGLYNILAPLVHR